MTVTYLRELVIAFGARYRIYDCGGVTVQVNAVTGLTLCRKCRVNSCIHAETVQAADAS